MVDLCLLEQKVSASFRGELNLLRSGTAVGMCWESHGSHTEFSVSGVLVSVGDYEVSPTPPITVTHKPEEDTFGVSPGLSSLQNCSVFVFLCCFETFAREISSFITQDSNQKDFVACVGHVKY